MEIKAMFTKKFKDKKILIMGGFISYMYTLA